MSKKIFTTGEVARLLGININTVIKWFDHGDIEGFRLPGSNERRIPLAGLYRFMSAHRIPMDLLETDTPMRRRHRRVACGDLAEMQLVDGRSFGPYTVSVEDLSAGGARLTVQGRKAMQIPVGDFDLMLSVSGGDLAGTTLRGKLAHLTSGQHALQLGMRFADMAPTDQSRVEAFVTSHS